MPAEYSYDYAIIRVVPRVERGEFVNAGVLLSCPDLDFLEAVIVLEPARLQGIDPAVDLDAVRAHLDAIVRVCQGGAAAGPIGDLPQRARFHWLVSPEARSSRCHQCIPDEPPTRLRVSHVWSTRWSSPCPSRAGHLEVWRVQSSDWRAASFASKASPAILTSHFAAVDSDFHFHPGRSRDVRLPCDLDNLILRALPPARSAI